MQQHGSTNKSPTKLNAAEINMVICLWMGKTTKEKTPLGDFKVTTPKNPLLSITSGYKKSYQTLWPISKYQPTVEPLPHYLIRLVL